MLTSEQAKELNRVIENLESNYFALTDLAASVRSPENDFDSQRDGESISEHGDTIWSGIQSLREFF